MSGDHNEYQKDKSYLDFECPRCGHCCQQEHTNKKAMQQAFDMLNEIADEVYCDQRVEEVITTLRQALETEKQWVGLTVLEVYECWKTGDVVEAVEAKLKEKNHG